MEILQATPENKLTSDRLKAFQDALEVFYIHRNISGRLKFSQDWPDAALYLLGEQLMRFDQEGTPDKELRERLEAEAESRRCDLLEILETIESKSAERGVLKIEYVQELVKRLGRGAALLVYSQKIVDRFLPESAEMVRPPVAAPLPKKPGLVSADVIDIPDSLLPQEETKKSKAPPSSSMDDLDLEEKPVAPTPVLQTSELDDVQPISIEQILPQPVAPVESAPPEPAAAPPPEKKPGKGKLRIFGIKDGG